ncbi:transglutaminase-like cysteine peptidase [Reinekea marinisedimentorum]|uniref:Transglutaminase-like cysteine proteinase BTLCP n=1 Tax=Reinekea marinisedimentorum TaxID=230495 RepID=A0A4R3HSP0_9GAMM|nr:transglutaminase-like cysteine peptidase [Reinekea marinisedimentorum]TCS36167.1 transglutaminase-like cysteine proteinase BTLCP [Reinekea marinisedimentorum]
MNVQQPLALQTRCTQWLSAVFLSVLLFGAVLHAATPLDFRQFINSLLERYGQPAQARGEQWSEVIEQIRGYEPEQQLKAVNDFFNTFLFSDDIVVWRQEDYWATPMEFIGRGAGDCEDFVIAKYYSLVEAGFPADKLRLMYVKAIDYNQHHMVLTYYPRRGVEPLVLDNLDPVIKPSGQRQDLLPIYSFNADFLWLVKARGEGQNVGSSDRLSLWQDLQQRFAREAGQR